MASLNTPESYDDMVLRRHYEDMRLEKKHWEDDATARAAAKAVKAPCVWKSYESCRNCGLYGKCFTLETQTSHELTILETGDNICRSIDELLIKAKALRIIEEEP